MRTRLLIVVMVLAAFTLLPAAGASAHVHGITPLLTLEGDCGVTDTDNTGANRAQSEVITGLIPVDVGEAERGGLGVGSGGFDAPVGCAD